MSLSQSKSEISGRNKKVAFDCDSITMHNPVIVNKLYNPAAYFRCKHALEYFRYYRENIDKEQKSMIPFLAQVLGYGDKWNLNISAKIDEVLKEIQGDRF